MTIEWKDGVLVCAGTLAVDDAEQLLQVLAARSDTGQCACPHADLAGCEHVHGACLQVLMAARVRVIGWPPGDALAAWLRAALEGANNQEAITNDREQ